MERGESCILLLKPIYLCVILGICAITDIREKKIKNQWILAGIAGFVFFVSMEWHLNTFKEAVELMSVFAVILFPLYMAKMLGAGDVKLLCMSALYVGGHNLWIFLAVIAASAGFASLFKLLYYRKLGKRLRYFYQYAKGVYLSRTMEEYGIPKDKKEVLGLGVPVFLGGISWCVSVYII